jgi:predicted AlkP superfamily phosphohydrolase/phosphomutase
MKRIPTATAVLAAALATHGLACDGSGPTGAVLPPPTGDRVLLIGIDAATWDVMRPLISAGRLPTFQRLVTEGWSATLRSMEPMVSPALWTTIATGKEPSQHGIRGFLAPTGDGEGQVPVTSNLRRVDALWNIVSRAGRTVNVVGWYVTWPVEPVNGVMVSDRFTPETRGEVVGGPESLTPEHPGVYPAGLVPELERFFVRPEDFLIPVERRFHERFGVYPVDATRIGMAEHLMGVRPADLTMVYVWGVDPMQHYFWKYYQPERWVGPPSPADEIALNREQIPDYYRDVDGFVAHLVARTGPADTVLIVSDHGAGPVETYDPEKPVSGDHRLEGIIIAAGNHVRRGVGGASPSILDVTPTVLYLLGLPAGADMPGAVITDLVDPALLARRPPWSIPTYASGRQASEEPIASPVDDRIKERLRGLGYIE